MRRLGIVRLGCFALATLSMLGCEKPVDNSTTFTLSTGVTVWAEACAKSDEVIAPKLEKDGSNYIVSAKDFFDCSVDAMEAYLTPTRDKRSTLVLGPSTNSSGCECSRAVRIKVSDRFEPGETVYVLREKDVIGHFEVPVEGQLPLQ